MGDLRDFSKVTFIPCDFYFMCWHSELTPVMCDSNALPPFQHRVPSCFKTRATTQCHKAALVSLDLNRWSPWTNYRTKSPKISYCDFLPPTPQSFSITHHFFFSLDSVENILPFPTPPPGQPQHFLLSAVPNPLPSQGLLLTPLPLCYKMLEYHPLPGILLCLSILFVKVYSGQTPYV